MGRFKALLKTLLGDAQKPCDYCAGHGQLKQLGRSGQLVPCVECDGTGSVFAGELIATFGGAIGGAVQNNAGAQRRLPARPARRASLRALLGQR